MWLFYCFGPFAIYHIAMITISFIGTGHMGGSIATILSKLKDARLLLNNRHQEKAIKLASSIGDKAKAATLEEALNADYIFIGVKPSDMDSLIASFPFAPKGIIVSMAAGINLKDLEGKLPNNKIIRIMPNTPVIIGKGMTPYCFNNLSNKEEQDFISLLSITGKVKRIEEKDMDALSVLTGSAPAYLDYFLDALIKAGTKLGLSEEEIQDYVLTMAEGTIALDLASDKSPIELGKEVCSPGGSTIEGVMKMEEGGIYNMMEETVQASYQKNKKIK